MIFSAIFAISAVKYCSQCSFIWVFQDWNWYCHRAASVTFLWYIVPKFDGRTDYDEDQSTSPQRLGLWSLAEKASKASFSFFKGSVYKKPKDYKNDEAVTVYYNPSKPSQAVLELPDNNESYAAALLIIFAVCLVKVWLVAHYGYY